MSSTGWRSAYVLIPVVLALITSVNTLWNYWASDDLEQVLNNGFIKHISNIPAAFTSSVWSFTSADVVFTVDPYFRPIFSTLFTLNYALFGNTPVGWHLINILIHAAVTLLVYAVCKEVTDRNWLAAITASLFAVHPAHAESVAWVSGVTDPLMTLFLLPSFYFYLRYRKRGAWYFFGVALVFFFLALLGKETAIALPAVVLYCELFHFRGEFTFSQRAVRASKLLGLFIVPIAIYVLMRYQALGSPLLSAQPRYPLIPSLLTIPLATLKYLRLMILPWGYNYQHYTDFVETAASASFLGPLVLLICAALIIARLRSRELTFAAVWFVALLSPALAALRQFEPAYLLQERYLYAPSIGVCLAIALGIEWLASSNWLRSRGRIVAGVLAVLLVCVWGAVFIRQNRVWDDTVSVYRNSVAQTPAAPLAHVSLARSYYDSGRPRQAEAEARAALALDPHCAPAYLTVSYIARISGKLDKACDYLEEGILAVPEGTMTRHDVATMYLNLGMLYGQRKIFDRGEQMMLRSSEISPRPVAWYYTAQFYFEQARYGDALAKLEQAAKQLPPWFAPIHMKLALAYEALGDTGRAESSYVKYLELAPPDAQEREAVRKHLNEMRGVPQSKSPGS